MARTNVTDVKEILPATITVADAKITAWIDIANVIITQYASRCTDAGSTTLTLMEKLLAAHFVVMTLEQSTNVTEREFGDSREKYAMMTGEGLKGSNYGQQLLMLDQCGILVNFDKQRAYSKVL